MRSRSHEAPRSRRPIPGGPRPWPALLLVAWALSWLAGAAHLVADHAHCGDGPSAVAHAHADGGACAHAVEASEEAVGERAGEPRGPELTTQDTHECAVLHLLASGSGAGPIAADGGRLAPEGRARVTLVRASDPAGGVPLLLLAPKNSPPRVRGRVLA